MLLHGGVAIASPDDVLVIERSLPPGHVSTVLHVARKCGTAASKLATCRMLQQDTACNSLPWELEAMSPDTLYAALDWLGNAQQSIEQRLAKQHLQGATLVL